MRTKALTMGYRYNESRLIYFMGALGTIVEWYDFAIYGHLAAVFAKLFFVEKSSWVSLALAYGVFFISYLARPVGALIYGYIGDYLGRRTALLLSITMMNISMLIMAFLPTWQSIGIVAPIILLTFRIIQGISTGGETAGALIYVLESVDERRHGFYGSLIWVMALIGVLLGSGVMATVTELLSQTQLYHWGWRLPYFIGVALGATVLILRAFMPESIAFAKEKAKQVDDDVSEKASPLREAYWHHKFNILLIICLTALPAASMTFILYYFPQSVEQYHYTIFSKELGISTIMTFVLIITMVLFGFLSDYVGKVRLVLLSIGCFLLLSYPILAMTVGAAWLIIITAQLLLTVMGAMYDGPFPAVIFSLSALRVRYTVLALGYNTGFALFGGAAPLVAAILVHRLHNYAAAAFYLMAAAFLSLLGLIMLWYRLKNERERNRQVDNYLP